MNCVHISQANDIIHEKGYCDIQPAPEKIFPHSYLLNRNMVIITISLPVKLVFRQNAESLF